MVVEAVLLLLVPYALPLLMPSWRWLLGYAFAVAILLGIWFAIWYQAVMATPTRTGLEIIGVVFVPLIAVPTAAGTVVRMVTLMTGERFVAAINILGAILLTCILVWDTGSAGNRAKPDHAAKERSACSKPTDRKTSSQTAVLRHRFRKRRAAAGDEPRDQDRCDQ